MKKKQKIIKLGSETKTDNYIYHLLGSKKTGYEVWRQPFEEWKGKKYPSRKNWHKEIHSNKIGECRTVIKKATASPGKHKK